MKLGTLAKGGRIVIEFPAVKIPTTGSIKITLVKVRGMYSY